MEDFTETSDHDVEDNTETETEIVETEDNIEPEAETDAPTEPEATEEPVKEEWKADYAYKAYGEEKVMDEWLQGLVTKDNQDMIRTMCERSGGFDTVKEKLEKSRTDYDTLNETHGTMNERYTNLTNSINVLEQQRNAGDFESIFKTLNISEDMLAKHMLAKMEYKNMDVNQRAEFDQGQQQKRDYVDMQNRLQHTEAMYQQTVQQQHETAMNQTLSDPQFQPAIEQYNARVGNPQAFRDFMYQQGAWMEQSSGKTPSVQDVVAQSMQILGLNSQPQQPIPQQPQQPTEPVVQRRVAPPVIRGGGAPVAQKITNIADLQKAYAQEYGN